MPKQHRWHIKRALGYALKDIENAQQLLSREGLKFETVHPDIFQGFASSVQLLEMTSGLVKKIDERI